MQPDIGKYYKFKINLVKKTLIKQSSHPPASQSIQSSRPLECFSQDKEAGLKYQKPVMVRKSDYKLANYILNEQKSQGRIKQQNQKDIRC